MFRHLYFHKCSSVKTACTREVRNPKNDVKWDLKSLLPKDTMRFPESSTSHVKWRNLWELSVRFVAADDMKSIRFACVWLLATQCPFSTRCYCRRISNTLFFVAYAVRISGKLRCKLEPCPCLSGETRRRPIARPYACAFVALTLIKHSRFCPAHLQYGACTVRI